MSIWPRFLWCVGILFSFFLVIARPVYANSAVELDLIGHTNLLVLQLGVILVAAWMGALLFRRLRLPAVLGELMAGVFIGPFLLGGIAVFGFPQGLFPLEATFPVSIELYSLATIASIVLLFLVGLETDIDTFLTFSVTGSVIGVFGVLMSFVAGDIAGILFGHWVLQSSFNWFHPVPLFMGVISTATSVGISARILSEKRKISSPEGVTILAAAVVDDVLGIIILAIIVSVAHSDHLGWGPVFLIVAKALGMWLGFTAVGLFWARPLSALLRRLKDVTTISVMSFALALLLAGFFEKAGLAMIIGAYVMGLSLSKTDLSFMIQERLDVLQRFFVPIFFCVMGMLVNVHEMASWPLMTFGLVYLALAVAGKIVGCSVPALFLNFNMRGALRVGVGMVPRGEVALIIAGIGLSRGIIGDEVFGVAVIMTFLTTLLTPPILDRMLDTPGKVLRKEPVRPRRYRSIILDMPNIQTAEFILNKVIKSFENEGFYVHCMEIPFRLYNIRRDGVFLTLKYTRRQMVFDCDESEYSFVHTLFYEVIAELEYSMKRLKTFTGKETIGKNILSPGSPPGAVKTRVADMTALSPLAIEVSLKSNHKEALLDELVSILIRSGQLSFEKKACVMADLIERETTMSTGMTGGIALPHAKTMAVDRLMAVVGIHQEGMNFDSLDKIPAKIFIMTLAPKEHPKSYLQFMADISRFLSNPENQQKIVNASCNAALYEVLIQNV